MSEDIDDGGPAFPNSAEDASGFPTYGMSLRDWYAGMALQGMLGNGNISVSKATTDMEAFALAAYAYADAMLKARGQ